ncbi:ATP-binding protein [Halomonas salipaludis]|uniref:Histidine kinase/HSP90-like ATPase domain-containing protein n=1 Tax=Halomonas salipaludis TaxID=2032625 RepID=A0A2A2ERD9_9GAMM|nr:triple tyrosine motif-containing protein [Halomonas salipaludis]PAU75044.1 hypothetical protein CK498_17965 [Halomonas salipaludis]
MAYFDGSRFHRLQLPDNGLFDNIYAIIAAPSQAQNASAGDNDLWVHARSGIYQIPAPELEQAIADPDYDIRYRTYDVMGGLTSDPHQVLPLPTAVRDSGGLLWFATANGVVQIDPTRHNKRDAPPKVAIESLSVDGVEFPATSSMVLAGLKRIEIGYTSLSLSSPEAVHFRYRLDGFDRDWHHAGSQRHAIYTGLPPGDYRFRVLALNQAGVTSQDEATLSFSVPQVFYLQPTFLTASGLMLAGLLWLLYRASMRRSAEQLRARLEARHAERERIARELHDTFLQGVQGLILRFQAITQTIPEGEPTRIQMDQILDRADQVVSEGRDRVLDLRSSESSSVNLLAALTKVGREYAQDNTAVFIASSRGAHRRLNPIVREEAYRIGHEAILNAFKHSGSAHINLHIVHGLREFELQITDDGVGVDSRYLNPLGRPGHWGLSGMQERACNIGAKLIIQRARPRGTEVRLCVQASSAYLRPLTRLQRWWQRLSRQRS